VSRNAHYHARSQHRFYRLIWLGLVLLLSGAAQAQEPRGTAAAIIPDARVVEIEDPAATENLQPAPDRIQAMVDRAITNLTGKATAAAAWGSLVSTQDTVGIKVLSAPGPNSGTRADVVAAVVKGLLAAGLPPRHIIVWDRRSLDLRMAGFYELGRRFGIRVAGSIDAGYDEKTYYETPLLGPMAYSDMEFGKDGPGVGRRSHVSKLLTQDITKIINITPLLHHNLVGVSGNLLSLSLGGVDNTTRFEGSADSLARAVPEIYALPILGDRVVLNVVDALICQYDGQQSGLLHYSTVLNQLRFSRDPVALDVLSLQDINHERELAEVPVPKTTSELYTNASLLEIGVSDPRHIQVEKLP
jgi:hypothetical protein